MTPHIVEAYGQAYLTAIGMGAQLQRERLHAMAPDDSRPEPATIRFRIKRWLSRAVETWRRPDAGQYETYPPDWIGL